MLAVAGLCAALSVFAAGMRGTAPAKGVSIIDTHAHIMRGAGGNSAAIASAAVGVMDELDVEKTILLPPPFPPGHRGAYGRRELEAVVRRNPGRFAFVAGGESLNAMIHAVAPEKVSPDHVRALRKEAMLIVDAGGAGFGELAVEHFSSGRGRHPYESTRADPPLLLALADIAASHEMPIDLHMEAVPQDIEMPERMRRGQNPERVKENISGFERLLAHNRQARIIWAHAGWDLTGQRSVTLMRSLLERHPNLYMSIKLDPRGPYRTSPRSPDGELRPGWVALFRAFPDRFVIGSDQFFDEGSGRVALARKLVDALPPEIGRLIASENARKLYRLDARAK